MKRGEMKERILAAVKANPGAKNVEIARMVGADQAYVSTVLQRAGLAGRNKKPPQPKVRRVRFEAANDDWIVRQCEAHNLDIAEFVNACVTDARLDDEELGAA